MQTWFHIYLINRDKSLAPLNLTTANWRQQMSISKRWNFHFDLDDLIIKYFS